MKTKKSFRSLLPVALFIFGVAHATAAQDQGPGPFDQKELETFLDSIFLKEMEKGKVPGAAIAIVSGGKIIFSRGYGFANLENKTPVDPAKTIFRIGSITKVFTAAALLQLVEKRMISIDADVNRYLHQFKIPETFSAPIRISHLLTHSSGLDEISRGRVVKEEKMLTPLPVFLKDRLVRVHPAGETSSYSTYGIALAGYLVEQVSRLSLKNYFAKNIFKPLQMNASSLGTLPDKLKPLLATGYEYVREKGRQPLNFVWFNTYPASDINSTASDMAQFMIALLEGGQSGKGKLLGNKALQGMITQQHTNHPGIPGWTYGLQVSRTINGYGGLEHGGSMDDGYSTLMSLMPEEHVGIFTAGTVESTNLHAAIKEAFIKRFFRVKEKMALRNSTEELKKDIARFEGSFRWEPYCHSCPDSIRGSGQSVKITSTPDGMLSFWGGKWLRVDHLLFQLADGPQAGQVFVAFKENEMGEVSHFFLGGPWTYEKTKSP